MRGRLRTARTGLIVALAALMTLLGAVPASANGTFTDDDDSVHEANIEFIFSEGITVGCAPVDNPDLYCPDDDVTRAQMATFLVRAFDLAPSSVDRFGDDDGNIHEGNINALAAAGITVGCNPPDNTLYCPNDNVTRAQMASFLARAVTLGDARPPVPTITSPADLSTFITSANPDTGTFTADVTFEGTATDPNGDAFTLSWFSSDDGFLGNGSPLVATLEIPSGQTSAQPEIVLRATDDGGMFRQVTIQVKLILPSP